MDGDDEFEDDRPGVDELWAYWDRLYSNLRRTGDRIRALSASLTTWYGTSSTIARDSEWIVLSFADLAATASRGQFEDLLQRSIELHHRGTDIMNPDHCPKPIPSPFVRRMPEDQADVEAKRLQRQYRHVDAYREHILQCLEHYVLAWTAMLDGCQIADWEMIDDEFPKLAALASEVNRAYTIWARITEA